MALTLIATYTSESVAGSFTIEQQSLLTSISLEGQFTSTSLEGQNNYITLGSLYTSESLIGKTYVELLGTHATASIPATPVDTPDYVTTGLMLHLDAEQSGSGQTFGDIGGTGNFVNGYMWESLDNYNPGPYTIQQENTTVFNVGDEIEVTGSIAARLDNFEVSPFSTENGVKFLDMDGVEDRGLIATTISNTINEDNGAAMWRFEDLDQSTIELWVRRLASPSSARDVININFRSKITFLSRDSTLDVYFGNTSLTNVSNIFDLNTWVHVVGVADKANNDYKIYKNGQLASTLTIGSTLSTVSGVATYQENPQIRIAENTSNSAKFQGDIAIVRIYDFSLSASEVSQNYNAELSRFT